MSELTVTFWGVRGGYPVPGKETVEFGGNTTCLEIHAGPHLIVIDAGTGIVGLGTKLASERAREPKPIAGTILFTHGHHDHTQGLAFCAPLRFADSVFHIFGPRAFGQDLADVLRQAMLPSMVPTALDKLPGIRSIRSIEAHEVLLLTQPGSPPVVRDRQREPSFAPPWAVQIGVHHSSNHPSGGTLCYAVEHQRKRVVFATDTEGYEGGDSLLTRFARRADLLIHDAEYTDREYTGPPLTRQGWGHSTWRMAVQVGQRARVKRLVLTHHHADHDDAFMRRLEEKAQTELPQTVVAREGMTIEL